MPPLGGALPPRSCVDIIELITHLAFYSGRPAFFATREMNIRQMGSSLLLADSVAKVRRIASMAFDANFHIAHSRRWRASKRENCVIALTRYGHKGSVSDAMASSEPRVGFL